MRYARAVWPGALHTPRAPTNRMSPVLRTWEVYGAARGASRATQPPRARHPRAIMNWQHLLETLAASDAARAGRVREAAEGGVLKIEARKPGKGQTGGQTAGPRILARWAVEWPGAL